MLPGAIYCVFPELPWANMVARPLRNPHLQALFEYVSHNFDGSLIATRGTGQQIVDAVKGDEYFVTDRAVDVQIVGLRKKLGSAAKVIETVRGVGYRFKE